MYEEIVVCIISRSNSVDMMTSQLRQSSNIINPTSDTTLIDLGDTIEDPGGGMLCFIIQNMIGMIDDDVRLIILTFLSQSHTQQNINSQAMFYNIKIPSRLCLLTLT